MAAAGGVLTAQHRFQKRDAGGVGEPRNGDLGQFPSDALHIQRGSDPGTGLVQQGRPLPRLVLLGDVE